MDIEGTAYRTVWQCGDDRGVVRVIDQRALPFRLVIEDLRTVGELCEAIRTMCVRGAGCIGATAGWGMYLAAREAAEGGLAGYLQRLGDLGERLEGTRPTAVNLGWAVRRQLARQRELLGCGAGLEELVLGAEAEAGSIANEDVAACAAIGRHGLEILRGLSEAKGGAVVNVLTHCNAGWLAFVDHGSATAPIYAAHDAGVPVHVWVDETRPRNQGARLTAWELGQHGVPHTVIVDNAGGHLMQRGQVDVVIVGTDRTTWTGDVANKIGTYLKALAARDSGVPFYVALPTSSIDWELEDGLADIPIEERSGDEVARIGGLVEGREVEVGLVPEGSGVANPAFDVTPARLVTGYLTERGVEQAPLRR